MISIEKAYFSSDSTKIYAHLHSTDANSFPISDISKVSIIKTIGGVESRFTLATLPEYTGDNVDEILVIDIEDGFVEANFSPAGVMEIEVEFDENKSNSYVTIPDEFYDMKAKMMSVNSDNSNISKMSKKLATFAFLERMMITAAESGYIDDANLFYTEMRRLSSFGHSNIDQKIPNCIY